MYKTILLSLLVLPLLFSCNLEDDRPLPESQESYYQLTVGNQWVYELFFIDSNGQRVEPFDRRDTVAIVADTLIRNETYYKFQGTQLGISYTEFLRDSLGFLVNAQGARKFSTVLFGEVFERDTIFTGNTPFVFIDLEMNQLLTTVEVPAGNFTCIELEKRLQAQQPDYPYGIRQDGSFYAPGVGLVQKVENYYASPRRIESHLVSYSIL